MADVNCHSAVDVNCVPAVYAGGDCVSASVTNSVLCCWNMSLRGSWIWL